MTLNSLRLATAIAVIAGIFAGAGAFVAAEAQAVFVARKVIGKVHHMAESHQTDKAGYDVATVMLDIPPDRLFAFALDRAHQNKSLRVVMQDPGARRFQVTEGHRTLSLTVVAITDQVSHLVLTGTAARGEESAASMALGAVFRICKEMNKECSLG